jgi:hypothetical protein
MISARRLTACSAARRAHSACRMEQGLGRRRLRRSAASGIAVATLAALAVTAQPAFGTSLVFDQHHPAFGFKPYDVRPGDIDGDGIVDLVLGGGGE